eukprot:gene9505-1745_t
MSTENMDVYIALQTEPDYVTIETTNAEKSNLLTTNQQPDDLVTDDDLCDVLTQEGLYDRLTLEGLEQKSDSCNGSHAPFAIQRAKPDQYTSENLESSQYRNKACVQPNAQGKCYQTSRDVLVPPLPKLENQPSSELFKQKNAPEGQLMQENAELRVHCEEELPPLPPDRPSVRRATKRQYLSHTPRQTSSPLSSRRETRPLSIAGFCGSISRATAEQILSQHPPGSYLIRTATKFAGYVISVHTMPSQFEHIQVTSTMEGYLANNRTFAEMDKLIQFYKKKTIHSGVTLAHPGVHVLSFVIWSLHKHACISIGHFRLVNRKLMNLKVSLNIVEILFPLPKYYQPDPDALNTAEASTKRVCDDNNNLQLTVTISTTTTTYRVL